MIEDFLELIKLDINEEEMFYIKLKGIDDSLLDFIYWLKEMKEKYPSLIINPYEIIGKKLYEVNDCLIKGIDYTTASKCYIQTISCKDYYPIIYFGIGIENIFEFERLYKNSMFFEDLNDAKGYIDNEFK